MNGLLNSTVLDVAIGLMFVYLLLAVICSAINEWIASWFNLRAKNLKSAIKQLLDGQTGIENGVANPDVEWFLKKFYDHPLIAGMKNQSKAGDAGHPSYLASRAFASVVMDIVTPDQSGSITFQQLEKGIQDLPGGDVRKALLAVIQNAEKDLTKAQNNIETWFDDTMERLGGWYKRKIQLITITIAVALVLGANADTIRMSYILWRNPTQRAQMVELAKARAQQPAQAAKNPDNKDSTNTTADNKAAANRDANNAELQELDNLLGWGSQNKTAPEPSDCWQLWARRLLGWFLTVVAVSLGAPFWFDLLNKIVNLRNTGDKPKSSAQTVQTSGTQSADGATKT
jgi:hypothetical protein